MCNRILYTLILHKYNPTLAGDSLQLATILQNIKKKILLNDVENIRNV